MRTNDETYIAMIAMRDSLDARQTELQSELEEVTRKLESVSTTLALLDGAPMPGGHRVAMRQLTSSGSESIDISSLRGLKQVEALKLIARHFGGQFETTIAKRIMLQAGLIKTSKNANNILFSVIQRSDKFERVQPGVYRLKEEDKPTRPERPQQTDTIADW